MTTEPQGAYMIWLPAGGAKTPAVGRDDRPRRALHPDGGQGDLPVRDEDAGDDGARRRSSGPASSPSDIDLFIPHQANIRIIEAVAKGLDLPMDKMFVNLDQYGNTSAASVPIALAEAVNEGRVKVGDNDRHRRLRGRLHVRRGRPSSGRPTRLAGIAGDAAVEPEDVRVRLPVDWDSVDPIPDALAEIMAPAGHGRRRRSTTSSPASRAACPRRRSTHDRPDRQDAPLVTGGSRGIGRAIVAAARDAGRRRRVHLPRQRGRRGRDGRGGRGARPPGAGDPGRRVATRTSADERRQGRRSRRSARSTSSSTTPASPATT